MSGLLEASFGEFHSRLDELEAKIINTLNRQRDEEMVEMKEQLRIKEKMIQDLIAKIGNGPKCSDEILSDITKKIEDFKIIEDRFLASRVSLKIHSYEIKAMAETIEELKIQYQSEMKELKEQAAEELQLTIKRYEKVVQELKNQIQQQSSPGPIISVQIEILQSSDVTNAKEKAYLKQLMG